MTIVFIIMFFIISGITIYLIYDYMGYKDNVDSAFEITTNYLNDTFDKVSKNIDATAEDLSKGINNNTKNITTLNVRTDGVLSKTQLIEDKIYDIDNNLNNVSSNLTVTSKNLQDNITNVEGNLYSMTNSTQNYIRNVEDNLFSMTNSTQNYIRNVENTLSSTTETINNTLSSTSETINNRISSASETINNRINNIQTNVSHNQDNLNQFDTALKKYFKFSEDNQGIDNEKIFSHVFNGINPNLQLLTEVQAVSGLTVTTSDNHSLKVCNAQNNCMKMNVDNDIFNITPIDVNGLTVRSRNNNTLANFDLRNDSIYLGGNDINSPLFIQNSNLYVNNLSVLIKEPGKTYTNDNFKDMRTLKITGADIYNVGQLINTTLEEYSVRIDYTLVNSTEVSLAPSTSSTSTSTSSSSYIINSLSMRIQSGADLNKNDTITYEIPKSVYGSFTGYNPTTNVRSYTIENIMTDNIDISKSTINSTTESLILKVVMNKNIVKNTPIFIQLYGKDIFTYKDLTPKSGNASGVITRI